MLCFFPLKRLLTWRQFTTNLSTRCILWSLECTEIRFRRLGSRIFVGFYGVPKYVLCLQYSRTGAHGGSGVGQCATEALLYRRRRRRKDRRALNWWKSPSRRVEAVWDEAESCCASRWQSVSTAVYTLRMLSSLVHYNTKTHCATCNIRTIHKVLL